MTIPFSSKSQPNADAITPSTTEDAILADTRQARYLRAKAARDAIGADVARASAALNRFPVGPMGLTPDAVKASPEYRAAKMAFDSAFAGQRCFNASFVRTFRREIAAERAARRAAS